MKHLEIAELANNNILSLIKMVYIRNKKVKGIDYAYLVQSVWDPRRNTSRQQTVKSLGNASQVTIEDIPEEFRNDSKILTFISAFHPSRGKEITNFKNSK